MASRIERNEATLDGGLQKRSDKNQRPACHAPMLVLPASCFCGISPPNVADPPVSSNRPFLRQSGDAVRYSQNGPTGSFFSTEKRLPLPLTELSRDKDNAEEATDSAGVLKVPLSVIVSPNRERDSNRLSQHIASSGL